MEQISYIDRIFHKVKIEILDNTERAKNLITVFWVFIGFSAIAIISGYFELRLYENAQDEGFVDAGKVKANDIRQVVIEIIHFAIYLITAVVFLNWFRRAYGNLHRMGIDYLRHSESMAVWSWFIPIVFLFRPVQIMYDIWTETQEQIKNYDSSYRIKNGNILLTIWWTLFIITHLFGRYVLKTFFAQNTVSQSIESAKVTIALNGLEILEALSVILMVYLLSVMEKRLAEEVRKSGGIKVIRDKWHVNFNNNQ